jgi:hypothetical protein
LRRRNTKAVLLGDFKYGEPVLVADIMVRPQLYAKELPKEYAEVKAYAYIWLPGYSMDGSAALVRLLFGPTPHGASATYLLTKKNGAWNVTKWAFAYYA